MKGNTTNPHYSFFEHWKKSENPFSRIASYNNQKWQNPAVGTRIDEMPLLARSITGFLQP